MDPWRCQLRAIYQEGPRLESLIGASLGIAILHGALAHRPAGPEFKPSRLRLQPYIRFALAMSTRPRLAPQVSRAGLLVGALSGNMGLSETPCNPSSNRRHCCRTYLACHAVERLSQTSPRATWENSGFASSARKQADCESSLGDRRLAWMPNSVCWGFGAPDMSPRAPPSTLVLGYYPVGPSDP